MKGIFQFDPLTANELNFKLAGQFLKKNDQLKLLLVYSTLGCNFFAGQGKGWYLF